MEKQNHPYSDWLDFVRAYGDPTIAHATDTHHDITIAQESVPIIFVPGIMGTRLCDDQHTHVWDPNHEIKLAWKYFWSGPREMKSLVIDRATHVIDENVINTKIMKEDPDFQSKIASRILGTSIHEYWDWVPLQKNWGDKTFNMVEWSKNAAETVVQQGWGQIAWGNYIDMLIQLSSPSTLERIDSKTKKSEPAYRKIFQCPVYAFGYNWIHNNKEAGEALVKYISKVINNEKGLNRICSKVIIVTHSMGGLVTRAAMQAQGGANVLGVIHGAQPVTGAPICYRRIRAGFEKESGAFGYIMGHSYEDVLPILANCVGGLELLPTNNYKSNDDDPHWLQGWDHNKEIAQYPVKDVYESIYQDDNKHNFFRLVLHPDGLTPDEDNSKLNSSQSDAMTQFKKNVALAHDFHDGLAPKGALYQHPTSYHMYAKERATLHKVRWEYTQDDDPNGQKKAMLAAIAKGDQSSSQSIAYSNTIALPPEVGSGTDYNADYHPEQGGAYFRINDPDPLSGDGTVPVSSGKALLPGMGSYAAGDVEHGDFYKDPGVRDATTHFIRLLLEQHKQSRLIGKD